MIYFIVVIEGNNKDWRSLHHHDSLRGTIYTNKNKNKNKLDLETEIAQIYARFTTSFSGREREKVYALFLRHKIVFGREVKTKLNLNGSRCREVLVP